MPEVHASTQPPVHLPNLQSDEAKIAYAAGVVDGEGCITIQKINTRGFRLYVQVSQVVKGFALLDFLVENFGAKSDSFYYPPGNRATKRTAFWSGNPAYLFLKKIRPLLLVKDKHADIAFEFQERINAARADSPGGYVRWDSEILAFANTLTEHIKLLNSRGKNQQMVF